MCCVRVLCAVQCTKSPISRLSPVVSIIRNMQKTLAHFQRLALHRPPKHHPKKQDQPNKKKYSSSNIVHIQLRDKITKSKAILRPDSSGASSWSRSEPAQRTAVMAVSERQKMPPIKSNPIWHTIFFRRRLATRRRWRERERRVRLMRREVSQCAVCAFVMWSSSG